MEADLSSFPTAQRLRLKHPEYDICRAGDLQSELNKLTQFSVAIDFSKVSYMDASALTLLARLRRRLTRSSGETPQISFVGVSRQVKRLFELVRFDGIFQIAS